MDPIKDKPDTQPLAEAEIKDVVGGFVRNEYRINIPQAVADEDSVTPATGGIKPPPPGDATT